MNCEKCQSELDSIEEIKNLNSVLDYWREESSRWRVKYHALRGMHAELSDQLGNCNYGSAQNILYKAING